MVPKTSIASDLIIRVKPGLDVTVKKAWQPRSCKKNHLMNRPCNLTLSKAHKNTELSLTAKQTRFVSQRTRKPEKTIMVRDYSFIITNLKDSVHLLLNLQDKNGMVLLEKLNRKLRNVNTNSEDDVIKIL